MHTKIHTAMHTATKTTMHNAMYNVPSESTYSRHAPCRVRVIRVLIAC